MVLVEPWLHQRTRFGYQAFYCLNESYVKIERNLRQIKSRNEAANESKVN